MASVRFSQTNANEFRRLVGDWKRSCDYRKDVIRGVRLTVTKHFAGGRMVGREDNVRVERRTRYMVRRD